MGLSNDERGWIMTVLSGIGTYHRAMQTLQEGSLLTEAQHVYLERP